MMDANNDINNCVNGAGTVDCEGSAHGRCGVRDQAPTGRHQATDQTRKRLKWEKEVNRIVIECWVRSVPTKRGYRKRMKRLWDEKGVFEVSEQRLADQARAIRTNDWLTTVEIEEIKRNVEEEKVDSDNRKRLEGDIENNENEGEDRQSQENDANAEEEMIDDINIRDESVSNNTDIEWFSDEDRDILEMILTRMRKEQDDIPPNLRYVDRSKVKAMTQKVNQIIQVVETSNITETNRLIIAAANVVADLLKCKRTELGDKKESKEPKWRRRIRCKLEKTRVDLGRVDRLRKGELRNKRVAIILEREYQVTRKGTETVHEELRQRVIAIAAKLQRYDSRDLQLRQNKLFQSNQKRLFEEIEGKARQEAVVPDAEESKEFWSGIWDVPVEHNKNAEWLKKLENHTRDVPKQLNVKLEINSLKQKLKKMPNWKGPGPDGVQGYWLKNFTYLHERITFQLDECLQQGNVPDWMTTGRTLLCLKDPKQGSLVSNFRPMTCLPLMWKLLTGVLAEELYRHLDENQLLPVEQKGGRKGSRGTKDQLLIDKMVIKNCKRRLTGLGVAWVDYKKAYDMIPHSWIGKTLEMFGIADDVRNLVKESTQKWNTELTAGDRILGNVKIRRGIFQGDSLSPLLFVIAMIPLSLILRDVKIAYDLGKGNGELNHLLFMDDLKLFAKNEKQLESLIHTVRIFSDDIRMEFGLAKCALLVMKRGRFERSEE